MLDAAQQHVHKDGGLTLSFDHLPMETFIRAAEVPRSSVYRIWNSHAAFVADLIQDLFDGGDFADGFDPATRHAVETVFREHIVLTQGTIDQRRSLMREMVRVGVSTNLEAAAASEFRRSLWTLASAIPSIAEGPARDAAVATVREIEKSFLSAMTTFYATMLGLVGLRLREPFTSRHIAVLTNTIVDSFVRRFELDPTITRSVFPGPGIDGEPAEWTYAAWSIAGAIDGMIEHDEDPAPDQAKIEPTAT